MVGSGGNGAHLDYSRVLERLGVDANEVDFRKGTRKKKTSVHADAPIEGATPDDISDFVDAVKAAKESRSTRPKGLRRFLRRR